MHYFQVFFPNPCEVKQVVPLIQFSSKTRTTAKRKRWLLSKNGLCGMQRFYAEAFGILLLYFFTKRQSFLFVVSKKQHAKSEQTDQEVF